MIDYDKLDKLMELPVSEEMIGAYLEGNLSEIESDEIRQLMYLHEDFFDISVGNLFETEVNVADVDIDNIQLPFVSLNDSFHTETTSVNLDDLQTNKIYNLIHEIDNMNLETANRIFGEGGNGSQPVIDPMILQGPEGVCAIRSQQIILRDYGIDISLEELKQYAIQQGWYEDGGGTPMGYVGAIIDACGIGVRQEINCTVYDLVNELAQGHRVIVGVDANELWADRNGDHITQTKEFIRDIFKEEANHALIVAGVEVNPNDPEDVKVILTDPGTGDLRIEYTLDQFMDAWEDSNCFMTTTTTPAPYQYDELHGCVVPSNFAVQHFVDSNSLPLQADVRLPEGYLASNAYYSEGHLNSVGNNVSFEDFNENYTHYKSVLNIHGSLGEDHFDLDDFKSAMIKLFSPTNSSKNIIEHGGVSESEDTDDPEDFGEEPEDFTDDNQF